MLLYIKATEDQCELYYANDTSEVIHEDIETYLQWLCECYGSTLHGRKKLVCDLLHIKQLPPILVRDNLSFILFAARDRYSDDWYYFNYDAIVDIKEYQGNSKIVFVCGQTQCIPCSSRSLKKQRERCVCLKNALRYRQNSDHLKKL